MQTVALILALVLGAVGLLALFGTFFCAQSQIRRRLPADQRRESYRSIGLGLLLWVAAGLLVNGMVLLAGLLFVALAMAVALWLRKTLPSVRAAARGGRERVRAQSRMRESLVGLPPTLRAYALFQLVTAVGIPLAILGGLSGEQTLLVAGLGLAGLAVLSTALALPIIVGRRRRPGA